MRTALLALALLSIVCLLHGRATAAPRIGDRIPNVVLSGVDGKPLAWPREKPVLVDFFTTWCGPCHLALQALGRLVREANGEVALVLVDVREDSQTVRAFLSASPPPGAQVALDLEGEVARAWGQSRFPTTFIVDEKGVIRHINRGYGPGYEERLRNWLRNLRGRSDGSR